jgi:hypothetical protein
MVNVVATGGVEAARSAKSLIYLALQPLVFVSFDADAAGDEHAQWWLKRLKNARKLRPLLKDINDMLMDNWDVRAWVGQAIHKYGKPAPVEAPQRETDVCVVCGAGVEYDSNAGRPYCGKHGVGNQRSVELDRGAIIEKFRAVLPQCRVTIDPLGYTIDDHIRHMQADRGDARTQEDSWTATHRKREKQGSYGERA